LTRANGEMTKRQAAASMDLSEGFGTSLGTRSTFRRG
jgi:hypothetical protein